MTTHVGIAPARDFQGTWNDAVSFCEVNGFTALELKYELPYTLPGHLSSVSLPRLRARIKEAGLFLSLHGPYTNIGSLIDSRWNAAVAEHLEAMGVAEELGARTYTLHGGWVEAKYCTQELFAESRRRVTESLRRIIGVAGSTLVCLENQNAAEPDKRKTNCYPAELRWFAESVPNLFFTFDVGHANVAGLSPCGFLEELGTERVRVAHVHDNDGSVDQHRALGQGTIDWEAFVAAYKRAASGFPLLLELGDREDMVRSRTILTELLEGVRQP